MNVIVITKPPEISESRLINLALKYDSIMRHELGIIHVHNLSEISKDYRIISSDLKPTIYCFFDEPIQEQSFRYELIENTPPYTCYSSLQDTFVLTQTAFMFTPATAMFPTEYKLKYGYEKLDVNELRLKEKRFLLIYHDIFIENIKENLLWNAKDNGISSLKEGGILIIPQKERLLSQLIFQRRFQRNVSIEFSFVPRSSIVNFQVFLGEAFSIMIGDGDNKTITLKKSIKSGDSKVEKRKAITRLLEPMDAYNQFSFKVERIDSTFNVYAIRSKIAEKTESVLLLSYVDSALELTIKERFKTIGFAVWRGSQGVELKSATIYQPVN